VYSAGLPEGRWRRYPHPSLSRGPPASGGGSGRLGPSSPGRGCPVQAGPVDVPGRNARCRPRRPHGTRLAPRRCCEHARSTALASHRVEVGIFPEPVKCRTFIRNICERNWVRTSDPSLVRRNNAGILSSYKGAAYKLDLRNPCLKMPRGAWRSAHGGSRKWFPEQRRGSPL